MRRMIGESAVGWVREGIESRGEDEVAAKEWRYEFGAGSLCGAKKNKKNLDGAQCLIDKRPNLLSSDRREVIEVTSFICGCYTQILKKLVAAGSIDSADLSRSSPSAKTKSSTSTVVF